MKISTQKEKTTDDITAAWVNLYNNGKNGDATYFRNVITSDGKAYLNKILLRRGSIAFFKDEVLGVLALPYTNLGNLDVYGRPRKIIAQAQNGYRKTLNYGEFVIMYDNNGRYPIYLDILQYAERLRNVSKSNGHQHCTTKDSEILENKS